MDRFINGVKKGFGFLGKNLLTTRSRWSKYDEFGVKGDLMSRLDQLQKGNSFSIMKLYQLQFPQLPKVPWKGIVLQPKMHPRFKFILWLALQRRLATVDRLLKYGVQIPQQCILCKLTDETFDNLFFECSVTNELWSRLLKWWDIAKLFEIGKVRWHG